MSNEKMYRTVSVKERLPNKSGYYCADNLDMYYLAPNKKWYDSLRAYELSYPPIPITYWLEEYTAPKLSQEELLKVIKNVMNINTTIANNYDRRANELAEVILKLINQK